MSFHHVVAYDGTERGDEAIALAGRLADALGAELVAIHVITAAPVRDAISGPVLEHLEQEAAPILAKARERRPGLRTQVIYSRSAAEGLHQVATDRDVGLLTIGSTHRGRVGRVLAGTTGQRLLSGAPCPVALAPRGHAGVDGGFREVIVGYDGGQEARLALAFATELATRAGAAVRVVTVGELGPAAAPPTISSHAFERDIPAREQAERMLAGALAQVPPDVPSAGDVHFGNAADILAHVGNPPTDLLVIGSRGYGPGRSVLVGSVGHALAVGASCPVVVVPRGAPATDAAAETAPEVAEHQGT
jgi:nucleotide-binding universal stress UspA family protein